MRDEHGGCNWTGSVGDGNKNWLVRRIEVRPITGRQFEGYFHIQAPTAAEAEAKARAFDTFQGRGFTWDAGAVPYVPGAEAVEIHPTWNLGGLEVNKTFDFPPHEGAEPIDLEAEARARGEPE